MCELRGGGGFDTTLVDERSGFAVLIVEGRGAMRLFEAEAGGHRWQRIPPTEKRGRVQTSTITVAVLAAEADLERAAFRLDPRDVEIRKTLGTGPGGQHRNKTESCVIATHRPTGLAVRVDMRSQHQSLAMALRILTARLRDADAQRAKCQRDNERRQQVGTGMRGDKIRTYRTQDDRVTDHRTQATFALGPWLRGDWADR